MTSSLLLESLGECEDIQTVLKLLAKAEAFARYEAARQILEFIGVAKERGLSLEDLELYVMEYVDWLNNELDMAILGDSMFNLMEMRIKQQPRIEAKA